MTAQYLTIERKHRQMGAFHASLADFSVLSGDAVAADIVRTNPAVSLYCLDDAAKQAIFVEMPPEVDLATAPFVYMTQYEQAHRLIAVPYASFLQLARALPEITHLIMIYMTGRCGSTLVSHLLNQVDSVLSLSEPDVATHFVTLRSPDGAQDAELRDLLDCTVRVLFKPTAFKTPSICALKLRNEGTQLMGLFQATFPQARNLFLYRDAIGYVTSFYRILRRGSEAEYVPWSEVCLLTRQIFNDDFSRLAAYLDAGTTDISIPQFLALWWLAVIEWYLAQHRHGIHALAVRYDDLNTYREQVVTAIFRYCGVPTSAVQQALRVFERDAQAGTDLAREKPHEGNTLKLTADQQREVITILQRHPIIKHADFEVPGTLGVEAHGADRLSDGISG